MSEESDVSQGLRKVLNRHGYGFHYAALDKCHELYSQGSPWLFHAAEYPVRIMGEDTRIDFILRHRRRPQYLSVECKRSNPALSNWVFVRAPYIRRNRTSDRREVLAEKIVYTEGGSVYAEPDSPHMSSRVFDLAFELKADKRGDPASQGRGQIERAATQVILGINGLSEVFDKNRQILEDIRQATLIPVIFTTATLWTSDVDLTDAELESGEFEPADVDASQTDWIWYRYHQSHALKHNLETRPQGTELEEVLDVEFARTIAVVSVEGIEGFLKSPVWGR